MKNTKEKILETALFLFNTQGLPQVTLRTIAKKMGISQGNLNYHFKKREDIIEALYFNLVHAIDESIGSKREIESALQTLFTISETIMQNFYIYRFFLLDFVQIIRKNETIRNHYLQLTKQREQEFTYFFELLEKEGLMRKEVLLNEYKNLYKRFQILSDFWISSAQISNPKEKELKDAVSENLDLITQAIFPYLTAMGQKEYHRIMGG